MNKIKWFIKMLYLRFVLGRQILTHEQETEIVDEFVRDEKAKDWAFGSDRNGYGKEEIEYWNENHDEFFKLKEVVSYSDMARIYLVYKDLYK